jgi:hypothetical protein
MRSTALAIALLMSGAAFAQSSNTTTTTTTQTQPDVDVDADVGVQPDGDLDVDADVDVDTKTTTTTTTTGTTTTGTDTAGTHTSHSGTTHTTMASAGGQVVAPSNANPERDARGIPVISDPAVAPAGWNGGAGTGMGGPLVDARTGAAMGAEASHPPCSKTVTDNCVQTYEGGRRR